MGFELATSEGRTASIIPAVGRRPPRARLGRAVYDLTLAAHRCGGGTVFDFRGTPETREVRSTWEDRKPVRVTLVARLAPAAMKGGKAILAGDRMVTLGRPHGLGRPNGLGRKRPASEQPRQKTHGRRVELHSVFGTQFFIETESPGAIEIAREEGRLSVRFPEALVEPDEPFAYAVFVGEQPYAGPPVLLGEPEVRFDKRHACFEVRARAFGAWSDAFDPADVALRQVHGRAPVRTAGRAPNPRAHGYYARDFVSILEDEGAEGDTERSETEKVEPRGWPFFAIHLPPAMSGRRASLSFSTRVGAVSADILLPTVATRAYRSGHRRLSGVTLRAPGPRGTVEVAEKLAVLAEAGVPAARLEVFDGDWKLGKPEEDGLPALVEFPRQINLDAAWRIDRALTEAGRRGVRLFLVCRSFRDLDGAVGTKRPTRRDIRHWRRQKHYIKSRWGVSSGFGGVEAPGDPEATGATFIDDEGPRLDSGAEDAALVQRMYRAAAWKKAIAARGNVFFDASLEHVTDRDVRSLARFLSALPGTGELAEMFRFSDPYGRRLLGNRGREGALWWIEAAPGREKAEDEAEAAPRFEFAVDGLDAGRYRLEWWDPRAGRLITTSAARVRDGAADLTAPAFTDEIAGRLIKLSDR